MQVFQLPLDVKRLTPEDQRKRSLSLLSTAVKKDKKEEKKLEVEFKPEKFSFLWKSNKVDPKGSGKK